ncbi:acyl carrier protein [Niastella caeni]|uniref:Acyl carrier protein n=1 Tax=Niastella caeni TaxID=2569763 RepID=A0A4S8HFT9_9BACT|nr:phosphopantetheine-binding protein [Niastella caeni]THU32989.1 acyl carrier protein [Niastella caeni]
MIARVKKILSEVMEDPSIEINADSSADLINDIGLDSLQMIEFLLTIESEFNFHIDYGKLDFNKLRSIESFVDFISNQENIKNTP